MKVVIALERQLDPVQYMHFNLYNSHEYTSRHFSLDTNYCSLVAEERLLLFAER